MEHAIREKWDDADRSLQSAAGQAGPLPHTHRRRLQLVGLLADGLAHARHALVGRFNHYVHLVPHARLLKTGLWQVCCVSRPTRKQRSVVHMLQM
jgi:hypothetical protein